MYVPAARESFVEATNARQTATSGFRVHSSDIGAASAEVAESSEQAAGDKYETLILYLSLIDGLRDGLAVRPAHPSARAKMRRGGRGRGQLLHPGR